MCKTRPGTREKSSTGAILEQGNMAMEKVYEELDKVKVENEKLRADLKSKAEICEHLKKIQIELLTKIQESSSKIEKHTEQLLEKEEEISVVKQANEDLKYSLYDKETLVKHLNAANDKTRVERDENNQKWEQENRQLLLALDEANEKSVDLEQKINVLRAEIKGLKAHLSVSQSKCSEAEKKAKNLEELRERDDLLAMVEEGRRKVEDQLKWKKEQFKHLEEAYDKLRDQFNVSKNKREQEKSMLLDEVSSLQTRLDSQTRITRDLENRLEMCNQALAREETQRKYLEVEISEFKIRFGNIFSECQDAKSQLDCLNLQRENEVAALRHLLGTKESFCKETEYRAGKLEQENEELLASLKELQEARIQEARSSSSLLKLQNKLKSVEQMHEECSANLQAKEAEWNYQREEMARKLSKYSSQLGSKDVALKVLEMKLEDYLSSATQLKLQYEEVSVMLLLLKSGMSEAQPKLSNAEAERGLHEKERIKNLSVMRQQLEMKNTALTRAQRDIAEECERTAVLSKRVETLEQLDDMHQLIQKEFNRCKEMVEESSWCQLWLKEQCLQVDNDSKEKIRQVCEALDVTNSKLAEEREKVESLLRRVESLNLIEGQWLITQKELESYKERLEEASRRQTHLEEQALQMENESREKLKEVCKDLDKTKSELTEEQERTASLIKRVESLDHIEDQWLQTQKELEKYKEMLEEASMSKCQLEEQVALMKSEFGEKLRVIYDALETANLELVEERERTTSLMKRLESSHHLEEQCVPRQEELDRYKKMFEESPSCQLQLEEQNTELKEICNALEKENSKLMVKICEGHEIELELCIWKCIAEELKVDFEEGQELCKELETSLLAQLKVGKISKQEKDDLVRITQKKEGRIVNLQQQIVTIEKEVKTRELEAKTFAEESILEITRDHNKIIEDIQKEIELLVEESFRRELEGVAFAHIGAERKIEHEKENLLQLVKNKDHRINGLIQVVRSMEEDFNSSLSSFSSQLADKQAQINLVHEAWEKIVTDNILAKLEMEEKQLMIEELEDDIHNVQEKLLLQEKFLSDSKKLALTIEAELEAKHLEMNNLTDQMEARLRTSEALVDNLKSEKTNLLKDIMKLSMDREILFGFIGGLSDGISEFSREDAQLMGFLERIVQSFDNNNPSDFKGSGELSDSRKENKNSILPSPETKMEAKHLEMKNLTDHMEARLKASEALIDELKSENTDFLKDIRKLSMDREFLLEFIEGLGERISELSTEDAQLMGFLGRTVQSFDNNPSDIKGSDELLDSLKENKNCLLSSPSTNKPHLVIEERSPLTQLN
ncbi:hypothetical protein V6N11_040082 [Hibiscus sabdariffa]|uniref:Uncharacterized protein n=1 Tax=Hibiscus sabdariffa TaxID=183260 RepID=A0ABR2RGE1_9ROSI